MQKITPNLWFDTEAVEAASFYVSVFADTHITFKTQLKNTPSGDCNIVGLRIMGYDLTAFSARSPFKFNPSYHFMSNVLQLMRWKEYGTISYQEE